MSRTNKLCSHKQTICVAPELFMSKTLRPQFNRTKHISRVTHHHTCALYEPEVIFQPKLRVCSKNMHFANKTLRWILRWEER